MYNVIHNDVFVNKKIAKVNIFVESVRFYMVTCVGNLGYKDLCMQGRKSIPERRKILAEKLENLRKEQEKIQASIDFILWKNNLYNDIESGKVPYKSFLLKNPDKE